MASLVAPLACGVVGATSGSATFFNEGTGTPATVYSDPEGVTVVTSHTLDSNGGIVRYVNNRVDVVVKDAAAATVRTFTWGTDARETRVENAGFTGTLAGGGTAPGGRSTVDAVLTSLYSSLGAIDGKVLVNGVGVNLQTALSGLSGIVFNVKSYGAVGNGSTDDRAAIVATIAAAIVAGGGTIFFPPGTYKLLGQVSVPNGSKVHFLGASENSVTIVQHTTATNGWFLVGTDSVTFAGLTFSRNAAAMTGRILQTAGKVNLISCTFAGWGGSDLYFETDNTAEFNCVGCTFTQNENTGFIGNANCVESRMRFNNCTFYVTLSGCTLFRNASGAGTVNVEFTGCYFRCTDTGIVIVSDAIYGRFASCHVQCTGIGGTMRIGDSTSGVHMTASRVVSASASIALAGASLFESGCDFSGTVSSLAGTSFRSEYRDHRILETTLVGATTSYTPTSEIKTHLLNYAGTNVGTLSIVTPSEAQPTGTRIEIQILHNGASGPSVLSWAAGYQTAVSGGPALTASIAQNTVLVFAFTFSGSKWVLTA